MYKLVAYLFYFNNKYINNWWDYYITIKMAIYQVMDSQTICF